MKMEDIVIGQEYAFLHPGYNSYPERVRVLEKGVNYYEAKGVGVRVDQPHGGDLAVVLGSKILSTWEDWQAEVNRAARSDGKED